jgi:hypothetical protein
MAESTNKNLVRILKKIVADNQRNWHSSLHNALWDDRVTPKEAIGNSPYFLVYGGSHFLERAISSISSACSEFLRTTLIGYTTKN